VIERDDHQIDEEMILIDEVSDEALEAAAFVVLGGLPTLIIILNALVVRAIRCKPRSIASSN